MRVQTHCTLSTVCGFPGSIASKLQKVVLSTVKAKQSALYAHLIVFRTAQHQFEFLQRSTLCGSDHLRNTAKCQTNLPVDFHAAAACLTSSLITSGSIVSGAHTSTRRWLKNCVHGQINNLLALNNASQTLFLISRTGD
jgi:hypothetical protein